MSHLEKLTLYVRSYHRATFIDDTHLHKEILNHMQRLHTFRFFISTEIEINDSTHHISENDIQRTFTNIGYHQKVCNIYYFGIRKVICSVFTVPFVFDYLKKITNKFQTMILNYVTYLMVIDTIPFKYEFFIRISKAFPLLKHFSIVNILSPLFDFGSQKAENIPSYSLIEYSRLMSLDIMDVDNYYIEQFLLDTKTHATQLTAIQVRYHQLRTVTENFTRNTTRRNCANIKRLIF
ncbi:unnamed protein product [Rotaria sp. Silwood2]|nr:unnamed protein product [Rotaria sp. Silwood2]CAF4269691.1 unnamed protein product [Rotaria sp. Silwood2]